jgi:hypothetical protein
VTRPVLSLIAALAVAAVPLTAQSSGAKPRQELSDSATRGRQPEPPKPAPAAASSAAPVTAPAATPARPATIPGQPAPAFRADFVRNQTIAGVLLYAPAFASAVAHDGVAWGATYMLVAGGSFVASAELSRRIAITDPMHRLATGAPIRGAIVGALIADAAQMEDRAVAGTIFLTSLTGTALALWRGQPLHDGEAAATLFGSDAVGLVALAASKAAGVEASRTTSALVAGGMLIGAPLGQAYAALASYNVTPGDLTAMKATAGVGMLAGYTAVANSDRTDRQLAAALAIGGVAGLVLGDRLLARRYDHTEGDGRFVMAGGVAGGLMGAGVALLTGGAHDRFDAFTGAMTTVGAAAGITLTQRYVLPKADGALRLGALRFHPEGVLAAASGLRGSYTVASLGF